MPNVSKELAIATSRFAEFGTGKSSFSIAPAFRETEETTQAGRDIKKSHTTEFIVKTQDGNRLLQIKRTGKGKNEIDKEKEIREKLFAYIRERLSRKFGAQVRRVFMERFLGSDPMGSYNHKGGSLQFGQFRIGYVPKLGKKSTTGLDSCIIRLIDAPVNAFQGDWTMIPCAVATTTPQNNP